jgi:hypothetical protein
MVRSVHEVARYTKTGGLQILHASLPRQLNFVQWYLIFVGLQYGTLIMSSLWHLKFWWAPVCGKYVHPCTKRHISYDRLMSEKLWYLATLCSLHMPDITTFTVTIWTNRIFNFHPQNWLHNHRQLWWPHKVLEEARRADWICETFPKPPWSNTGSCSQFKWNISLLNLQW